MIRQFGGRCKVGLFHALSIMLFLVLYYFIISIIVIIVIFETEGFLVYNLSYQFSRLQLFYSTE